jgi:hypothetical protein
MMDLPTAKDLLPFHHFAFPIAFYGPDKKSAGQLFYSIDNKWFLPRLQITRSARLPMNVYS